MNIIADPIVPNLSAISGLLLEKTLTIKIPAREHIKPKDARVKGKS